METGLRTEAEEGKGDELMSGKKKVEKETKKPNALLSMTVKLTEEYPREIYDTNIMLYTKLFRRKIRKRCIRRFQRQFLEPQDSSSRECRKQQEIWNTV